VLDLEKRWKKDMIDLKPDMLSVLIGVNDYTTKIPLDQYEQVYAKLIGDARAVASERLKWWEVKNVNMWD
jgi:hypothetical protein